jgi:hypothetical protein
MKRIKNIFVIVIICVFLLSGCTQNHDSPQSISSSNNEIITSRNSQVQDKIQDKTQDITLDKAQDKAQDKTQDKAQDKAQDKTQDKTQDKAQDKTQNGINNFRIYTQAADSTNDFDNEILNNQIDKDYDVEFNQAATTQEFVEVQKKYTDKWKDEMQIAITKLKSMLTANDFNNFKISQDEWENQLRDCTKSDRDIIENSQYGVVTGSMFRWTWASNIREQYRERTIHIKYMIYLLQNKGDN